MSCRTLPCEEQFIQQSSSGSSPNFTQYYLDSPSLCVVKRAKSPAPPSLEPRGGVEDLLTEGMRGGGAPTDNAPTRLGFFVRMPLGT